MDQMLRAHVRAFLLAQQIGEDPEKNLAKIKVIANSNPAGWDGKLPTGGIRPDTAYCRIAEATPNRPVVPWWWYAEAKEPFWPWSGTSTSVLPSTSLWCIRRQARGSTSAWSRPRGS